MTMKNKTITKGGHYRQAAFGPPEYYHFIMIGNEIVFETKDRFELDLFYAKLLLNQW